MEDWNFGHYLIIIFMGTLTFAAIKIAHDSDKKKRAIYDKHIMSKPRDGDNT